MPLTIIADAGSTKVEWAALLPDGRVLKRFVLPGLNALMAEEIQLIESFMKASSEIGIQEEVESVFYYGAGCASPLICKKVSDAISSIWPSAEIKVATDLLGACRALLGRRPGIACILGTGSNSALFDGTTIKSNIPPLGFILGDEGSGTALGKRLIKELFKGNMPDRIKENFFTTYQLSLNDIIKNVYRCPQPNKFIASLVPFIRNHIKDTFIHNMVVEEFAEFFRRNIMLYPDAHSYSPAFTGSIAYYFEECLKEAASREGYSVGMIEQAPMDSLIYYHASLHNAH